MKKIISILVIAIGLFVSGCEEPAPIIPDCELYEYGEITVTNATPFSAWVDCSYDLTYENDNRLLPPNGRTTYKLNSGRIYIWYSRDLNNWYYDDLYLYNCESLSHTFIFNKKATNFLEIYRNGQLIETVTEVETIRQKQ